MTDFDDDSNLRRTFQVILTELQGQIIFTIPVTHSPTVPYFIATRSPTEELSLYQIVILTSNDRLIVGHIQGISAVEGPHVLLAINGLVSPYTTTRQTVWVRVARNDLTYSLQARCTLYSYAHSQMPLVNFALLFWVHHAHNDISTVPSSNLADLDYVAWGSSIMDDYDHLLRIYDYLLH